jgi:hypothetical protein
MNAIEQLNNMIRDNNKYLYRNKVLVITGFDERSGSFRISCTENGKETIIMKDNVEKFQTFLDLLVPFEDNMPVIMEQNKPEIFTPSAPAVQNNRKATDLLSKNEQAFSSLSKILLEDIDKVRKDPTYVPQAKQVANSAQTIVNLVKLQLEILTKG